MDNQSVLFFLLLQLEAKVKDLESKNVGEDQSVRQEYNELSEKCKNLSRVCGFDLKGLNVEA